MANYIKNKCNIVFCSNPKCDNSFKQSRSDAMYCSKNCRMRVANDKMLAERKGITLIVEKKEYNINKKFLVRGPIYGVDY